MPFSEIELYYPKTKQHWRKWLIKNHHQKVAIWLVMYKKSANKPSVNWSEAVDEALCFGWIDSTKKTLDHEKSIQYFTKRKPKSTWSKINKQKVSILIEQGLMTKAGLNCIEIAKQNGSWIILDTVEELEMPLDLEKELNSKLHAMAFYLSLTKSVKKSILQWIIMAKRPETRQKRITEIVELAQKQIKPKLF